MDKRHWIAAVLVVSLGLNLVGAGALLARWYMGSPSPPMVWALQGMDQSVRQQMRPLLRDKSEAVAPLRRAYRESLKDIRKVVTSEPLDEVALAAALADMRAVSTRYQLEMHNTALELLPKMSREQRVRLLQRLMQGGAVATAGGARVKNHPDHLVPRPPGTRPLPCQNRGRDPPPVQLTGATAATRQPNSRQYPGKQSAGSRCPQGGGC